MLPGYRGAYDVGLTTFGLQVPRTVVGKGRVAATGEPALVSEEVVFNVFYPASTSRRDKKSVSWSLRPFSWTLKGWASFSGYSSWLIWPLVYLGRWITMPVYPNAKLLTRPAKDGSSKWPLAIFSHGLAGTRNAYSHFCGSLASEGYVVLALEHHDGTAPYCMIRNSDGKLIPKLYLTMDAVQFDEEQNTRLRLREDQLQFRCKEIYAAHKALRSLTEASAHGIYLIDGDETEYSWDSWKNAVDMDHGVTLTGHSFGGATVFTFLSTSTPQGYSPLNITHAVALDPWLDPLPAAGPSPTNPGAFHTTVINSERFTLWKDHFMRLKDLISNWHDEKTEGRIFTIVKASHPSFSDFLLFNPVKQKGPLFLLDGIHRLSLSTITDTLESELQTLRGENRLTNMGITMKGEKKALVGKSGAIICN